MDSAPSHNLSPELSGSPNLLAVGNNDLQLSLDHPRHLVASDQEPVRTLFVSGLPLDVKSREVHNLFRTFGGYQTSTVSFTGERKMPVAFVVFSDRDSALNARSVLQGINFDPESPTTLRIELAKSNSKSKLRKKEHRNEPVTRPPRRVTPYNDLITNPTTESQTYFPSSKGQQGMYNEHSNSNYFFSDRVPFMPPQSPPRSPSQIPCPTLFIGNIAPLTKESDLEAIFKNIAGFDKLKTSRKGDSLMCFIDFQTLQASNSAMAMIQKMGKDTFLRAAEGRRIRIEFARSRMGGPKTPTWS